jgi:short-subunit dehydrogenase
MGSIRDISIVLTGASSGIGRATALALAKEHARLFLVARRTDLLTSLEEDVKRLGGTAFSQSLDLSRRENVEKMMQAGFERLGRIDVLINNAAFGYFGTVEHTPPDLVREIFALNFEAPLTAIQLAIPIMRTQGGGQIINISSVAGKRGIPLSGIYSATKFALNGISDSLRVELRNSGIRVSTINPGATRTQFGEAIRKGDVSGSFKPIGPSQSAEQVAASIIRCIHHPKAEVYPYWAGRIVAYLSTIAPGLVDAVVLRSFRDRMSSQEPEA